MSNPAPLEHAAHLAHVRAATAGIRAGNLTSYVDDWKAATGS
ncbi:hypothetical protein ACGFZB_12640 [Streptomyces cinerochromogenes]|uniref:Integrase n=1 Tax=Streptomyces cinerochromogenes TaxID=66422 RepID=A0ABW7B5Y9_9ACTN